MSLYSKGLLSGSTDGIGIVVVATATPGTLLHTAVAGTDFLDELWLWAMNLSAAPVALTVQWGGVTDPTHLTSKLYSIPANSGPTPIAPGWLLRNGLIVRAFAGTASVIVVQGYVNQIR